MLTEIDELPIPKGATAEMLDRGGGISLRYALWPSRQPNSKGTICVFHGRAEFIEKYFEVVENLQARGFAVASVDWRGQGLSTRQIRGKGHVDRFEDYVGDLDVFMREIVLPECPPPYFALAHSMGGNILLRYAQRGANPFDRILLSAPMVDLSLRRSSSAFVHTTTEVLRFFGLGSMGMDFVPSVKTFKGNKLTTDEERFNWCSALLKKNPALDVGGPTVSWIHAATESIMRLTSPEFAALVTVPVLMVVGTEDEVISVSACELLGQRMKSGRTILIPGAKHELLMESDRYREKVWAAFDAFIPGEGDRSERPLSSD